MQLDFETASFIFTVGVWGITALSILTPYRKLVVTWTLIQTPIGWFGIVWMAFSYGWISMSFATILLLLMMPYCLYLKIGSNYKIIAEVAVFVWTLACLFVFWQDIAYFFLAKVFPMLPALASVVLSIVGIMFLMWALMWVAYWIRERLR